MAGLYNASQTAIYIISKIIPKNQITVSKQADYKPFTRI